MTHTLRILSQEHKNLSRLLDLMDSQIAGLTQNSSPDHDLLRTTSDYLSGYPDEVHHPKEDLILRKMQSRDAAATSSLMRLLDEHREIARLTSEFSNLVAAFIDDDGGKVEPVRQAARKLVDSYRRHIEMEEAHFFPKALEILTDDDWAEINFAVSERDDPIFDESVEKYQDLRNEILRLEDQISRRLAVLTTAHIENQVLRKMWNVEAFNSVMAENQLDVRLERLTDGDYRLTDQERLVCEIPSCSENRAAWCAFFYLRGQGLSLTGNV